MGAIFSEALSHRNGKMHSNTSATDREFGRVEAKALATARHQ